MNKKEFASPCRLLKFWKILPTKAAFESDNFSITVDLENICKNKEEGQFEYFLEDTTIFHAYQTKNIKQISAKS